MEHLKLESITDSPDFWNDPYLISSYCNSILQATKKEEDEVSILICDYNIVPRVSYDKRNSKNKYSIFLPKLKDFYIDPKIQKDDIKLRKAFLKHELAHIVFSEMETYVDHHKDSDVEIRMLANAIEDVRIEWAFGKRFPGSNDTFFEIQNSFYLKGKTQIENAAPSILNLSLYFLYRSKKFEFENTFPIQIYDKIFQKYSDFLSLSTSEVVDFLKEIQNEFNLAQEELKEEIEEFNKNIPEKEKIQMTQKEYDDYTANRDTEENSEGDGPEIEITDEKKKNPPQQSFGESEVESEKKDDSKEENSNKLDSDSKDSDDSNKLEKESDDSKKEKNSSEGDSEEDSDSDSEEDSDSDSEEDSDTDSEGDFDSDSESESESDSDSESDSQDDSKSDSNDSKNQNSFNSEDSINNKLDFSDMIKDQMKNNLEKELKNINDFNSEEVDDIDEDFSSLEENIEDPNDSEHEKRVLNILKIINPVEDDFIAKLGDNHNVFEDFLKYNNSKTKSRGSQIVDISRFLSVSSKRKKQTKSKKGSKVSNFSKRTIYSQLASKNSKNIIGLINFFKLKFQNKEKSKRFFNKEEGDLHNESLYKIFSHEQDKRIFSSLQKSLVIKEDVSFLLDFSGSMTGSKLKYLLESLVILNEVFSKIEISYNVFSFSGRDQKYYFKYSSLSEKTLLCNAFNSKFWIQDKFDTDQIAFSPKQHKFNGIMFGLINRNSKSEERKKIIELLLEIVFGAKNYSQISSALIGGSTPEIPAVISLYNNLPKQKLFIINDGEYDSFDFFGREIKEIKNIDRQNIRNIDYYRIGYTFLSGQKIKINNSNEKNIFSKTLNMMISIFPYSFKSNNGYKFFSDPNQLVFQDLEIAKLQQVIQELKYFIEDIYYDNKIFGENNSIFSSRNKYFSIEKKYFQGKDITEINFIINKTLIPEFSLKVMSKIIFENYKDWYDDNPISCNLFLDSDVINDIKDVYKILCFQRPGSLMKINEKVDLSRYTYRDLISKMRNSGWSIFGLGIESDSGKNYIGDKNFTFIKNHSDIRSNLEKKVKKIII